MSDAKPVITNQRAYLQDILDTMPTDKEIINTGGDHRMTAITYRIALESALQVIDELNEYAIRATVAPF